MVRRTPRTLAAISLAALVSIATWWPGHNLPAAEAKPGKQAASQPPAGIPGDARAGTALMARGDAAAEAGQLQEALEAWLRGYERLFPTFRDRPFKAPVQAEYLAQSALRERLLESLAKELPDERILAEQQAMAAFGFITPDFDLKESLLKLHTEQVAGFYDPEKRRLYLVQKGEAGGPSGPFDSIQQKVTLAHEMTHALQDQYHDLRAMQRAAEADDDRSLALSALIEGEATLNMMVAMDPGRKEFFLRMPPAFLDLAMTLVKPLLSFASGPSFHSAPVILRETMLFPYLKGLTFCLARTEKTGTWKPVNESFARPPLSTEQILHPERYPDDVPMALHFPDVVAELGEGWALARSNTLGELAIRTLLAGTLPILEAEKAAEGWDGDFYRVYARAGADTAGPHQTLYVWASTFDSQQDAREFREAYARVLAERIGFEPQDVTELRALPNDHWGRGWLSNECLTAVLGRGNDVWVLSGIPEKAFPAVLEKARQVTRQEKK